MKVFMLSCEAWHGGAVVGYLGSGGPGATKIGAGRSIHGTSAGRPPAPVDRTAAAPQATITIAATTPAVTIAIRTRPA
jgi:hypothetical protein